MVPLSKGITSYPFTGASLSPAIQSFVHHLRHCRLLQVVALRCCMQGQHLTCQLLCLKLPRRSRRLAAAFFAPLVLLPLLEKVIFQGFSHATSIPRTRTWNDVTWSHSSAQTSNVPTA